MAMALNNESTNDNNISDNNTSRNSMNSIPGLLSATCNKFVKMADELKRSVAFLLKMHHVCSRIEQLETCECSNNTSQC